jgi:hypothetical protein
MIRFRLARLDNKKVHCNETRASLDLGENSVELSGNPSSPGITDVGAIWSSIILHETVIPYFQLEKDVPITLS